MKALLAAALLSMAAASAHADGFDFDPYISVWPGGGDTQDVAVGDVNGDRLDDVVVGSGFDAGSPYDFSLQVFLQSSNGRLATPKNYGYGDGNSAIIKVALADLNADGVSDIVACQAHGLTLYLTNGSGGFTRADLQAVTPSSDCVDVAFLDVDQDGHEDVVAQGSSNGASIYYGDGAGRFTRTGHLTTTPYFSSAVDSGDLTGDGRRDLLAVSDVPRIYPVKPQGGFAPPIVLPGPDTGACCIGEAAIGDFDGNGRADVAVVVDANRPDAGVWIYAQQGSGAFDAPYKLDSYDIPTALLASDLDLDGRQDLLLGHTGWNAIGHYLQGSGALLPEALNPAVFNQWHKGLAQGDINDDGCTDALITDPGQGLMALHGQGCQIIQARNDFDGDGRSDILWRNSHGGANTIWLAANSTTQQAVRGVTSQAWQVAGVGDFNGDGASDILWHDHTTGSSVIWDSGLATHHRSLTTVTDLAWQIVGVGDFDGDRFDDILWRNTSTGNNTIWRSGNSTTQRAVTRLANPAWQVASVDDFNGDGHDDILWHNPSTGGDTIWLSGRSKYVRQMTAVTDTRWTIAGTGDFDGDGRADVFWRHSTKGSNSIWRSADSTKAISVPAVTDTHWTVAAIGDYTGDRKADLVWRNIATGENAIWRAAARSVQLPTTDVTNVAWRIVP